MIEAQFVFLQVRFSLLIQYWKKLKKSILKRKLAGYSEYFQPNHAWYVMVDLVVIYPTKEHRFNGCETFHIGA